MATVSERSRELSEALLSIAGRDSMTVEQMVSARNSLIEQALLAERRLAMEEAITIANGTKMRAIVDTWLWKHNGAADGVIEALRAAAEKEVGK